MTDLSIRWWMMTNIASEGKVIMGKYADTMLVCTTCHSPVVWRIANNRRRLYCAKCNKNRVPPCYEKPTATFLRLGKADLSTFDPEEIQKAVEKAKSDLKSEREWLQKTFGGVRRESK